MRLRIATSKPLSEPDDDEDLLLAALRVRGVDARMAAWNDPRELWDEPIPTVIRSTWDYVQHFAAFDAWLGRAAAAAPLWNPLEIVRANLHKRYLLELEARGIAIVDTELVERGARTTLSSIRSARGWADVVVKPEVGAASYGARRFRAHDVAAGEAHLAALAAQGDVLVQRYEPSVEGHGERAITWIDGEFTHAVRKSPRFDDGSERVSDAMVIEPDELDLAQRVLAPIAPDLLYARVDVARGGDGRPRVMEVELVEPSLFLSHHPPALERLVQGLVRRLR